MRPAKRNALTRRLAELPGARKAQTPGFITPCSPVNATHVPNRGSWIFEIKYDGYRVQAHLDDSNPILFTRRGYDWTERFSAVAQSLKKLAVRNAVIDGEIVVPSDRGTADFQLLQADLGGGRSDRLVYFVFDLLFLDGFDLREVALHERKRLLGELIEGMDGRIRMSTHIEADGAELFQQACAMRLEGVVCKERGSAYRSGEQETWVKLKCVRSDNFPIVAFVEKLGAKPRRIASLYLGRRDGDQLLYAGKAQTGFKQEMLYDLRERLDPYIRKTSPLSVPIKKPKATWVEPVLEAEVEYSSLTSDKLLRAPVYKGVRDDLARVDTPPPSLKTRRPAQGNGRVSKDNILQPLPTAVVPTREQLATYWHKVAPKALHHLAHRPLKLVRHVGSTTFYHKGRLPPIPASVRQLKVRKREGGEGTRLWIEDVEGLLGLVDIGVVEIHPWNSTIENLECPDVLVFDLDPGSGVEWDFVVKTALALRDALKAQSLSSWPKLTGGKGIHVMAPISGMLHDEAHRYSRALVEAVARSDPKRYTTSAILSERPGRLFLDYLRNGRGTTAVGSWSPRARHGFPIAVPTTWPQIASGILPDAFTMAKPFRASRPPGRT
jgi:bifunctional non-homologous end joining protein LigD